MPASDICFSLSVTRLSRLRWMELNYLMALMVVALFIMARPSVLSATPLHEAAHHNDIRAIHRLLVTGMSVNIVRQEDGNTPLHVASARGHMQVLILLLKLGADVNVRNPDGLSPLHLAAYSGNAHAVSLLLDWGADISAQDNIGATPLHIAALNADELAVLVLMRRGADITIRTKTGLRPIDYARAGGMTKNEAYSMLTGQTRR